MKQPSDSYTVCEPIILPHDGHDGIMVLEKGAEPMAGDTCIFNGDDSFYRIRKNQNGLYYSPRALEVCYLHDCKFTIKIITRDGIPVIYRGEDDENV